MVDVSIAGNLSRVTASMTANTVTTASITASLKNITGSMSAVSNVGYIISGQLNGLSSAITVSNYSSISVSGSIKRISGSTRLSQIITSTSTAQLKKITGSVIAGPKIVFTLSGNLHRISGSASVQQTIPPLKPRPASLFAKKIYIQNPTLLEPQLTQVTIGGVNLLQTTNGLEGPYNAPSVDAILHGDVSHSYLGAIQNGSLFLGNSAVTIQAVAYNGAPSNSPVKFDILPSDAALPLGLALERSTQSATIVGTVHDIPINATKYEFILRITNAQNVSIERYFYFDVIPPVQQLSWIGPYNLGNIARGNLVNIPLPITNTLGLPLAYTVTPALPPNLQIINDKISGIVNANTALQAFSFVITATDGSNTVTSPTFTLNVTTGSTTVTALSDHVAWVTTNKYLGSTYTTLPSYFGVKATNQSGQTVTYSLAPYSNQLPTTLTLDSVTGNIVGLTPFLLQNQTFTVTIRASTASFYSDKTFSFTVLKQFDQDIVLSVSLPMEDPARLTSALTIWNPMLLNDSLLFRPGPTDSFGRVLAPKLSLGSRSFASVTDVDQLQKTIESAVLKYSLQPIDVYDAASNSTITEYYCGLNVILGDIKSKAVYNPDGQNIYDVIYVEIVDFQNNAGGFLNGVETPIYNNHVQPPVRIYPKSLNNMRQAFLSFSDQFDSTNAGLPLSQRTGWQPFIELAFIQPGQGNIALGILQASQFPQAMRGLEWTSGLAVIDEEVTVITGTFSLNISVLADSPPIENMLNLGRLA